MQMKTRERYLYINKQDFRNTVNFSSRGLNKCLVYTTAELRTRVVTWPRGID